MTEVTHAYISCDRCEAAITKDLIDDRARTTKLKYEMFFLEIEEPEGIVDKGKSGSVDLCDDCTTALIQWFVDEGIVMSI